LKRILALVVGLTPQDTEEKSNSFSSSLIPVEAIKKSMRQ